MLAWPKLSSLRPSSERTSIPVASLPIVCPQRHSQKAK